ASAASASKPSDAARASADASVSPPGSSEARTARATEKKPSATAGTGDRRAPGSGGRPWTKTCASPHDENHLRRRGRRRPEPSGMVGGSGGRRRGAGARVRGEGRERRRGDRRRRVGERLESVSHRQGDRERSHEVAVETGEAGFVLHH